MRRSQPADCAQRDSEQVRHSRVDAETIATAIPVVIDGKAMQVSAMSAAYSAAAGIPKTLKKIGRLMNGDCGRQFSGSHLNGASRPRADEPNGRADARRLRIVSVIRCTVGPRFTPKSAFGVCRRGRAEPVGADPVTQDRPVPWPVRRSAENRWNFNLKLGVPD